MNVNECNVELFTEGGRRNIIRMVRDIAKTGYITSDWGGTVYIQWKGYVLYGNRKVVVWGYTQEDIPYPPTKWANDTF